MKKSSDNRSQATSGSKSSSTHGSPVKPGGGGVIHNDPSKRDVYSGNNPAIYQGYDKPSTQLQGTATSKSSGLEK